MKKIIPVILLIALTMTLFGGCREIEYEIASYQGQLSEGQTKPDYNKELFYRNDKQTGLADPFVMDNTSVDGYYYMYGTEGSLFCYRSQNLMDWEPVGNALDIYFYNEDGTIPDDVRSTWQDIWAPEVVYDADEGMYYMFFSMALAMPLSVHLCRCRAICFLPLSWDIITVSGICTKRQESRSAVLRIQDLLTETLLNFQADAILSCALSCPHLPMVFMTMDCSEEQYSG